jgi:hypothetical protein
MISFVMAAGNRTTTNEGGMENGKLAYYKDVCTTFHKAAVVEVKVTQSG